VTKLRLGLPLLLSLLGTLLTIPYNKRYHVWLGIIFSLLSAIHTINHKKSLQNEFSKESFYLDIFKKFSIPTTTFEFLMQKVTVSHYSPGRIRLYSESLVNNPNLAFTIHTKLSEIQELSNFVVNPTTGSILLTYMPENLVKNPQLKEIETLVLKKYKRS
jgi:hypothetical protein